MHLNELQSIVSSSHGQYIFASYIIFLMSISGLAFHAWYQYKKALKK